MTEIYTTPDHMKEVHLTPMSGNSGQGVRMEIFTIIPSKVYDRYWSYSPQEMAQLVTSMGYIKKEI